MYTYFYTVDMRLDITEFKQKNANSKKHTKEITEKMKKIDCKIRIYPSSAKSNT